MVKSTVNDWSQTAAANTDVGGINIAENCAAANINNAIREVMKQVADVAQGTVAFDELSITTANIDTLNLTNALSYTNLTPSGYLVVGAPTGGQQGTGSINAESLYVNGVLVLTTFPWAITRDWSQGAVVADGDITLVAYAPFAGTISALKYKTGNGSFAATVKINGTTVTGLSGVAVNSSTYASTNATAANTFVAGDVITVTLASSTSDPTDAVLALRGTRTS